MPLTESTPEAHRPVHLCRDAFPLTRLRRRCQLGEHPEVPVQRTVDLLDPKDSRVGQ